MPTGSANILPVGMKRECQKIEMKIENIEILTSFYKINERNMDNKTKFQISFSEAVGKRNTKNGSSNQSVSESRMETKNKAGNW